MVARTAAVVLLAGSLASSRPAEACHFGTEIMRPRSATAATTALVPVPLTSEQGELLGFGAAGRF